MRVFFFFSSGCTHAIGLAFAHRLNVGSPYALILPSPSSRIHSGSFLTRSWHRLNQAVTESGAMTSKYTSPSTVTCIRNPHQPPKKHSSATMWCPRCIYRRHQPDDDCGCTRAGRCGPDDLLRPRKVFPLLHAGVARGDGDLLLLWRSCGASVEGAVSAASRAGLEEAGARGVEGEKRTRTAREISSEWRSYRRCHFCCGNVVGRCESGGRARATGAKGGGGEKSWGRRGVQNVERGTKASPSPRQFEAKMQPQNALVE